MTSYSPDPAGRCALITGAGTGIGRAIALELARAGAAVGLLGRRPDPLQRVATEIASEDGEVLAVPCDVTKDRQVTSALAAITGALGPIDILVSCAGAAWSGKLERADDATLDALVALNLRAPFVLARAVARGMKERGWGRIVNVASTAALRGYRYTTLYTATKHAVAGLTRSLSAELVASGVTVNAVCPGFTDTAIIETAARTIADKTDASEEDARRQLGELNPLGRLVTPEEVAHAVLYLVGSGAAAVSGHCLVLDGGTQPA